jgi:hypothetical protein
MPITFRRPETANVVAAQSAGPPAATGPSPLEALARAVSPQAADAIAQQRTLAASILRDLYGYLSANVGDHPGLAPAIPALSQAVAEYRAGTDPDPFHGARQVYALIQQARATDPALPEA